MCLALIAPVSFAWAQKVDPNKLPKVDCNTFTFSSAFLDKYPKAPAACLEGRTYEGTTYAKFNAKVYINNLPDYVTLELMERRGYHDHDTASSRKGAGRSTSTARRPPLPI